MLVGCGETQPTGKAPDISIRDAAGDGNIEVVKQRLAAGADVNAKVVSGPNQGSTPLDAANGTNYPKTANLLRKHGGKTGEELKAAVD